MTALTITPMASLEELVPALAAEGLPVDDIEDDGRAFFALVATRSSPFSPTSRAASVPGAMDSRSATATAGSAGTLRAMALSRSTSAVEPPSRDRTSAEARKSCPRVRLGRASSSSTVPAPSSVASPSSEISASARPS